MMFCLTWVISMVAVVLSIPFLVLLERKVLGYIQMRKGPKKVGFIGVLQPMMDGVKLVMKEGGFAFRAKSIMFWVSSFVNFFFMLLLFMLKYTFFCSVSMKLGVIFYLCVSSLLVYSMMTSGWGSNSKYSFLGGLRGAAQIMSYEMVILTLMFFPTVVKKSFNLKVTGTGCYFSVMLFFPIFFFWVISMIAETNRSPFDFAEGESELVSGFNTEYGGMGFTLLFLGEYGNIIFISYMTSFLFFSKKIIGLHNLVMLSMLMMILIFRGTFPRFRYDLLMSLAWKVILPWSLMLFWILFMLLKGGVKCMLGR